MWQVFHEKPQSWVHILSGNLTHICVMKALWNFCNVISWRRRQSLQKTPRWSSLYSLKKFPKLSFKIFSVLCHSHLDEVSHIISSVPVFFESAQQAVFIPCNNIILFFQCLQDVIRNIWVWFYCYSMHCSPPSPLHIYSQSLRNAEYF